MLLFFRVEIIFPVSKNKNGCFCFQKRSIDEKQSAATYIGPRCRLRLGVSHLLLLFTTVTCNYSRIYNSVLQKFTEKRSKEGDMIEAKSLYIYIVTLNIGCCGGDIKTLVSTPVNDELLLTDSQPMCDPSRVSSKLCCHTKYRL